MDPTLAKLFDSSTHRALKRVREGLESVADKTILRESDGSRPAVEKFMADIERWAVAAKLESLGKAAGIGGEEAGR